MEYIVGAVIGLLYGICIFGLINIFKQIDKLD